MKENKTTLTATEMENAENGSFGGLTPQMIIDANERENPERYVSPLRRGDIAFRHVTGTGLKALWEHIGTNDAECDAICSAAAIEKCKIIPDLEGLNLRKDGSSNVAAISKWVIMVRPNGGEWLPFSLFAVRQFGFIVPRSLAWKAANDAAFVIREGFIRRKGAAAFVKKAKKTAAELEAENAKLLEELRELKAELAKK